MKGKGSAWADGPKRFADEPSIDKIGPSAIHYTPNYNQCS